MAANVRKIKRVMSYKSKIKACHRHDTMPIDVYHALGYT